MSYVKIHVGGKGRGWKFNQLAWQLFSQYTDLNDPLATAGYALLYAGLKANCYVKREELTKEVDGKEVAATFEDVCDWYETMSEEDAKAIDAAFQETTYFATLIKAAEEQIKKKTVKKKKETTGSSA